MEETAIQTDLTEVPEQTSRAYEACLVLRAPEAVSAVESMIARYGGEVTSQEDTREARLAYPIKKQPTAFVGLVIFRLNPENLAELDKELRLSADVLRHLIITPPLERKPRAAAPLQRRPRIKREVKAGEEQKEEPRAPRPSEALTNEALEKQLKELSL